MLLLYALLGGILSGILNTLASSGSAVTLPLLFFLGLHETAANATNRLGIVFGSLTSVKVFHSKGLLPWGLAAPIAGVVTAGLLTCCLFSTLIFVAHGQVAWDFGLALGADNVIGSWLAAQFASRPDSKIWVYRLLLVVAGEILALVV